MILTYRVGGRESIVRKLIVLCYGADKGCSRLPRGQLLTKEGMEYSARGVKRLKLVLNVESREDVVGVANGKVKRLCIYLTPAVSPVPVTEVHPSVRLR